MCMRDAGVSHTDNARLFLGLELSDEARRALSGVRRRLEEAGLRGRLYDEDLYHLTLCFLGGTPRADIARVTRVMEQTEGEPLSLTLAATGTFKGGAVLWAGVAPNPALTGYQARLAKALRQSGFPVEEGTYRPHITLGRQVKPPIPAADVPPVSFIAPHVTLFESTRVDGRLVYLPLFRRRFG